MILTSLNKPEWRQKRHWLIILQQVCNGWVWVYNACHWNNLWNLILRASLPSPVLCSSISILSPKRLLSSQQNACMELNSRTKSILAKLISIVNLYILCIKEARSLVKSKLHLYHSRLIQFWACLNSKSVTPKYSFIRNRKIFMVCHITIFMILEFHPNVFWQPNL